jgi:5-methylcytosine-specific restriction endonuclease McrA
MSQADILRNDFNNVVAMRVQGVPTKAIADRYGVTNNVVKEFLKVNGIRLNETHNTSDMVAERISDASGGQLVYVDGYVNKESSVRVRCVDCGGEFYRTYHHITTHGVDECPICKAMRQEAEAEEKRRAQEIRREQAEAKRRESAAQKELRLLLRRHDCPVCGTSTVRPVYCSDACARKANNATHEHRRRARIEAAMVDKDITVDGLFKRDGGICHLCGGRCDYEDFVVVNGTTICGDWYPSIDHVIPLSKGGEHSWSNVKLAHRICNSIKGDTAPGSE